MQFLLVKDKSGLSPNKKSKIKQSFIDTTSVLCDHIGYEWESEDNTLYFIGRNPEIYFYKQYDVFNTDNNDLTFIHGWVKKEDNNYMLTANEINKEIINERELDGYYVIGKIDSKGFGNLYRSLFSPGLFYSNSGDVFAISNRISTLSELFNYKKINKKYIASRIEYHGKALTFDTMYENVYQVPYGTEIIISDNLNLNRIHDFLYDNELQKKYNENKDEYWDECHKKVSSQLKAFLSLGIEKNLEHGITGGKDSRFLLSFWHKYLSSIWTWGPAYSPEVIVGRMCGEKLKLKHTPRNLKGSNNPQNLMNHIPGHLFNTEFERSPWDLHALINGINDTYKIDGQEMIKAQPYKDEKTIDAILDISDEVHKNNIAIEDELNIKVKIDNYEISLEYLNEIENINKFPVLERILGLGRWVSLNHDYRYSNSFVIGLLLTNIVLKYNYNSSVEDILEQKLHYELIKRNCPALLKIPLFNAKFAQVDGFNIENKIPAKLSNQIMFLVRYFDFLKDYILENYDLISDIVKKSFILDLTKEDLLNDPFKCFSIYDILQFLVLLKNPDFKNLKYLNLGLPQIPSEEDVDTYDNDCVLAFVKYNEDIMRLKNENMRLKKENNNNILTANQSKSGDISSDTAGFVGMGGAKIGYSPTDGVSGGACYGSVANTQFHGIGTDLLTTITLTNYSSTIKVKSDNAGVGKEVYVYLIEYNNITGIIGSTYHKITLSETYQEVKLIRNFGSTGNRARIAVIDNNQNPGNYNLFVDQLQLRATSSAKDRILEGKKLEERVIGTVPDYTYLKKLALKGKNGYVFLINDSNSEIRQHFDDSYTNNFNVPLFIKNLNYKRDYCKNKDIKYYFFIAPDKSLICKDFLPFDIKLIKRDYDLIKDLAPDFSDKLDHTSYFKTESHINYIGGKELAYHYLNYVDNDFKREDYNKLIDKQISSFNYVHVGDLLAEKNWSYSDKEKEPYLNEKAVGLRNKFLINLSEDLPEEFEAVGIRKTEHYKNDHGFTNLRVLIFRDSTVNNLKDTLSVYFAEMLLYWDHWFFNKELIDWYKPDIILEIRTERFLENMKYEIN